MARKKAKNCGGVGPDNWLNTYAGMVTMLLVFFILLFSMSSLDAGKFNKIVNAFTSGTSSHSKIVLSGDEQTGRPLQAQDEKTEASSLDGVFKTLEDYVERRGLTDSVDVSKGDGYVFIRFMDETLFEPDSAVLKPGNRDILLFVGNSIKPAQNQAGMISIHGHTAAASGNPGFAASDRLLSSDRANAVLFFFEDTVKIDPKKMFSVGWGKDFPITSNNTEEGRSKNRRVEILIGTENLLAQQLDNVYEKLVE